MSYIQLKLPKVSTEVFIIIIFYHGLNQSVQLDENQSKVSINKGISTEHKISNKWKKCYTTITLTAESIIY